MQRSQGHQCAASSARKEKTGEIPPSNVTGALPQRSFRPVGPGSGGFSREDVPQVKGQPGCSRTPPAVAPTASAFRDILSSCVHSRKTGPSLLFSRFMIFPETPKHTQALGTKTDGAQGRSAVSRSPAESVLLGQRGRDGGRTPLLPRR